MQNFFSVDTAYTAPLKRKLLLRYAHIISLY